MNISETNSTHNTNLSSKQKTIFSIAVIITISMLYSTRFATIGAILATAANTASAAEGTSEDGATTTTAVNGELCYATCTTDEATGDEVCRFNAKVDLHAGELGYYTFQQCGDRTNPTLGLEVGKTYEFVQSDVSNYYHPLGLAYFPDGAHAEADELEPGIAPPGSSSTCAADMTCPAPMYYLDGEYKGVYSNNEQLVAKTTGEDNFGLDDYEPFFFHPLPDWLGYGEASIFLKFDEDTDYTQDIFYFCHIHNYMTGRIKLIKDGEYLAPKDVHLPEIDYSYDSPAEHDQSCGTYGLNDFQLPHPECPEKFVCDAPEGNAELTAFSGCIDSMNCAMMAGMTTSVQDSESEVALFMHQMIPHHQNAVNMAKALMKTGKLQCDDITEETDDCALEIILREIISGQNQQIQTMRAILEAKEYPEENDCIVSASDMVSSKSSGASDVSVRGVAAVVGIASSLYLLL